MNVRLKKKKCNEQHKLPAAVYSVAVARPMLSLSPTLGLIFGEQTVFNSVYIMLRAALLFDTAVISFEVHSRAR